ncbi:uncharacterized protein [Panulirus ornatus]|uniref:uncharacterized protein n=1 Tax=Panulirus ornatus TaxID=150431 RepID=UPI003A8510EA
METWLLIGLATSLVLASEAGGAGATRLQGDPSSSQHPAHAHTHSPPCPHPDASSVPTTTSLLKPDYKIITELPKPKPGFYLNKQFQQKKAATTSRANIDAREKVFETKVGTLKLFEPRKPKPGYYLNRQFQKKTQITKEEVKKTPRKIVDDSGRYWTVAELPEPEAGYYLNKQFQRRRVFPVQDSSVKSDAKVQVFLLTSTEAPLVKVPHTTLPLVTESPAINFGHTASTGTSRDANFYNVFSVPETGRRPSDDVQQPFAHPCPQEVPSREETKSSIPSGRESSVPEDDNEAADIRAGFGRPSTLAQLLQREDASAKLDTESPAVTEQQPQRQRPQTEQPQGQRPQRRQHQLRAQTERQERQRPQRTRQQQRARAEQQHGQKAQVEPQRRQRVQQQRQRAQEEQQPRERAQPQRQRAQQLRLRAQQLRQKVQEEQQERQRAQAEQQERQRAQAEQQERQRAQAEQQERQRAQAEQQERQRAQAKQQEIQRAQEEQQKRLKAQAEQQERQRAQAEQRERQRAQAEQQERQRAQAERRERQRAQAEQQERQRAQEEQRQRAQAEQQQQQQERRRTHAEPQEKRQRPEERRLQPRTKTERRTSGFSCEGREYGYYPDVESDCQGYHICNPISMGGGSMQFHKYSFQCSPGMKWHQGSMACVAASSGDHICQIEDAFR